MQCNGSMLFQRPTINQQLWLCHWLLTVCKPNLFPILSDAMVISRPINLYIHCPKCYCLSHTCILCHLSEIVSQDLWWSVFVEKDFAIFYHRDCNLWQFWEQFGAILDDSGWVRSTPHSLHPFQMDLWFVFKWICDHGFRFPSTINCREWEQKVRRDDDTTVHFNFNKIQLKLKLNFEIEIELSRNGSRKWEEMMTRQ